MNYTKLGLTICLTLIIVHCATRSTLDQQQRYINADKAQEALIRSTNTIDQQIARERELRQLIEQNRALLAQQAAFDAKRRREIENQKAIIKQLSSAQRSKQLIEKNKASTAKQAELREKRQREIAQRNEKRQSEITEQKLIQERRLSTCKFWISEYRKTQNPLDKGHRDNACKDANYRVN